MVNKHFGKLKVIEYCGSHGGRGKKWTCLCDCSNIIVVHGRDLLSGNVSSCGCSKIVVTTHGLSKSKTYAIWAQMKQRTQNPNLSNFKYYGGRGITVCDRWLRFENFIEDMGECPNGMQIDRINNDGSYEPNNCRWSTPKVNSNNRRKRNVDKKV